MIGFKLRRFIAKKEVKSLLEGFLTVANHDTAIWDEEQRFIYGNAHLADQENRVPIICSSETIGWVAGKTAAYLGEWLAYLAERELERKNLANETLEKYRELNLFYGIAHKLGSCLEVKEVTELLLNEARKLIPGDHASLMLINYTTGRLEVVATIGESLGAHVTSAACEGIAGFVIGSRVAEVVNNAPADPRFVPGDFPVTSLLCAPLVAQEKVLGVINLSTSDRDRQYRSSELKLFNALASQAAAAIENALLHEQKVKEERIKSNLERYLAPQVVAAIIADTGELSLNTQRSNITMLFSDIRSFTSTCERLEPEEIVAHLNEYFSYMVDIIFQNRGTVNKFVGDMIVAMFGAPGSLTNSEQWAIQAAIGMQKYLNSAPDGWIQKNFLTGIGINTGNVVVGNIGSPQHMDYTAIGDEMNVASRLQSLAQGGQILVSRRVYEVTEHLFAFKEFGTITVKGKQKSVQVYEVVYS